MNISATLAINRAIADLMNMHGSVTGEEMGEPLHHQIPEKCDCIRGQAIRKLREIRSKMAECEAGDE